MTQYDPMEFDLADYRQRLRDRTDDYELKLDGARVVNEIERLRDENVRVMEDWDEMRRRGNELAFENERLRKSNNTKNYFNKKLKREIAELKGRITVMKTWGYDPDDRREP